VTYCCRWVCPIHFVVVPATSGEWTENIHMQFKSLQKCSESEWYRSSIPLKDAMRPDMSVLLAVRHNGEPLTADHGSPSELSFPEPGP